MAILQITIRVYDDYDEQWLSEEKPIGSWIVDWGDGCMEVNTEYHIYKQAGIYQITVRGDFGAFNLLCPSNIISLDKEEGFNIKTLHGCFYYCNQLISVPHDWDVSKVTDMRSMFSGCVSFNQDLSHWNLKEVNTRYMFADCLIEDKHKPKGLK